MKNRKRNAWQKMKEICKKKYVTTMHMAIKKWRKACLSKKKRKMKKVTEKYIIYENEISNINEEGGEWNKRKMSKYQWRIAK